MAIDAYDALAPYYQEYARRRAAYCDAVDRCIAEWRPPRVKTMLDVGSGDGARAVRLAASLGVDSLVLSDPSRAMIALCREVHGGDVLPCAAESLPADAGVFDVITCVWNVLGAIEQPDRRLEALRHMCQHLAPTGRLFLDVHNRYNMAAAGAPRVLARAVRDVVRPDASNGLVSFTWTVGGASIPTRGYLFTEREMLELFDQSGLRPVQRAFVHYETGAVCGRWSGQMLFALDRV